METLQTEKLVELIEGKKGFNSHQAFDGHETRRITEDNEVAMDPSQRLWESYILTWKSN